MSGPWDRPSRDPEGTWPSEDLDPTTPTAPEQATDDPWASRDLWPEPSRDASPGWDDWPTEPAQIDYVSEEPPPPVLSDPWAESWSDESSLAPAPRDAWSEPPVERPPFEDVPERVEPRAEQPEATTAPEYADPAPPTWEPPGMDPPLAVPEAEAPATASLEPWSVDADPWTAAVVDVERQADDAPDSDEPGDEREPTAPVDDDTPAEPAWRSEDAGPGDEFTAPEDDTPPSQPFAGAFSGLGRAARTVLPDWLADPQPAPPPAQPDVVDDIVDAESGAAADAGTRDPDADRTSGDGAAEELPAAAAGGGQEPPVVEAIPDGSEAESAADEGGPRPPSREEASHRPWWRSVGPWASSTPEEGEGTGESPPPVADAGDASPQGAATADVEAPTVADESEELNASPDEEDERDAPELPAEEAVEAGEDSSGPYPAVAAEPLADAPLAPEPEPDGEEWPSVDVREPDRATEAWEPTAAEPEIDPAPPPAEPAVAESSWGDDHGTDETSRAWAAADTPNADSAMAADVEARARQVEATPDVEPRRWDDPDRPAVESTQVLPTSWAATPPDPASTARSGDVLDPVTGDIRTRLGAGEPDVGLEVDDDVEPQATTAEQAVPWLIGFILLLAGMVIVLLALIFAGEESLGGTGPSPSASGNIGLISGSASASPSASPTRSAAPSRSAATVAPSVAPTPTPVALPEYGPLEMLYQGRSAALAPIYLLHREFTIEEAPQVLAQDPNLDVRRFAWAPDGTAGVALYSDVLVSVEIGAEKRRLGDGLSTVTFGDEATTVYAVRVTEDGGNDVATVVAIDFASADTRDVASITYARPDLEAEASLAEAQFADDGGAVRLFWTEDEALLLWAAGAGSWTITPDDGTVTEATADLPFLWAPDGRRRIGVESADGQTTLRVLDREGETSTATTFAGLVSHVRWSPSGDRVVFTVGRSASGGGIVQDLFLWDLEQSVAPTQLTSTGAAFGAEWRGSQARWEAP